jgi:hypothetical protein
MDSPVPVSPLVGFEEPCDGDSHFSVLLGRPQARFAAAVIEYARDCAGGTVRTSGGQRAPTSVLNSVMTQTSGQGSMQPAAKPRDASHPVSHSATT